MKTKHCYQHHKHCEGNFCSQEIDRLASAWAKLFRSLRGEISSEYRCSDDPDDTTPGMTVTIGFTPSTDGTKDEALHGHSVNPCTWHYQTGDNSYTGGAYGHAHWAVISLYRRSNSFELARQAVDEIAESVASHAACEPVAA